ncbi:substrate-binding periplasmic protein [Marinospirillum perlucidum]|uniref:substrate-binding periplasmic protein n=1 Tax=Marinospirillum perlucidum TaxID=1982602 RepID=UPI000DF479DC|nr:ABC transporter substrate-binding protein [Marinospirillum perlucidum]
MKALLGACLLLAGGLVWADSSERLRALIMETEPWGFYQPEQGELQGIWIDIARLLEDETGIEQQKRLAPYARVMESLALGDADISYLIRSPDRDDEVLHAGLLFHFGSVVQARQGIRLNDYEDLLGLRIGVLQGIRLSPRFDQDKRLHKISVRNYETQLNMLEAGRLDAIAGNSLSLAYLQEKRQLDALLGDRLILQVTPVTLQFSRSSGALELLPVMRQGIEDLRAQGRIQAVLDAWAGPDWRVGEPSS